MSVLSIIIVTIYLAKTAPLIIKSAWAGVSKDKINIFLYLIRLLKTIYNLISDFDILYYLIYGITAIVGTVSSPFLFAFHLFEVLIRYPVLLNVVRAVWLPKKAILFTFFLYVVLMYFFSLFAYYQLYESYPPGYCDSTWVCLLTTIDRSFKYDGGLGGFMHPSTEVKPYDNGYFFLRFFYDNISYILLMIIMINVVSGIIIDTFGRLREQFKEYTDDLENICFICGYDKETIEKNSPADMNFEIHIKEDHNLWNYLFFIGYLKNKDQTEFTGIESYVIDQIQAGEINWFPKFKCLCMTGSDENNKGDGIS